MSGARCVDFAVIVSFFFFPRNDEIFLFLEDSLVYYKFTVR